MASTQEQISCFCKELSLSWERLHIAQESGWGGRLVQLIDMRQSGEDGGCTETGDAEQDEGDISFFFSFFTFFGSLLFLRQGLMLLRLTPNLLGS